VGTRGDVEPHLALSLELAARGHDVTLAAPVDFESQSQALGVDFHPVNVSFRALCGTSDGSALLGSDNRPLDMIRQFRRVVIPIAEQIITDIGQACAGAELVCYTILGLPAYYFANEMGIPSIATGLQPMGRTRAFASPLYPFGHRLPAGLNLLTHLLTEQAFWQLCRPLFRAKWGAVPFWGHFNHLYRQGGPILLGYSPALVPRPGDYPAWMHVTGEWRLPTDDTWTPPSALAAFLAGGPPPVCVNFGSMNTRRIDGIIPAILRAIAETGRRSIVLTGWWDREVEPDLVTDDVYVTESVPHSWLFPRVAAVIHHGGAGTVAAAVRAAVPSVVVPFFFDQRFWGETLYRRGVGPTPISGRNFSASTLKRALAEIDRSTGFRRRLEELSRVVNDEDGLAEAAGIIEEAIEWTPVLERR
jgi:UDP:flavonoid glycosyltransferase YjiC (YdhE family)